MYEIYFLGDKSKLIQNPDGLIKKLQKQNFITTKWSV